MAAIYLLCDEMLRRVRRVMRPCDRGSDAGHAVCMKIERMRRYRRLIAYQRKDQQEPQQCARDLHDAGNPRIRAWRQHKASRTRKRNTQTTKPSNDTTTQNTRPSTAAGSMKATVTPQSSSSRTTTLQGSKRPMSASASRARRASDGLQAPRICFGCRSLLCFFLWVVCSSLSLL